MSKLVINKKIKKIKLCAYRYAIYVVVFNKVLIKGSSDQLK